MCDLAKLRAVLAIDGTDEREIVFHDRDIDLDAILSLVFDRCELLRERYDEDLATFVYASEASRCIVTLRETRSGLSGRIVHYDDDVSFLADMHALAT